jgi:hypothetical protein
MLQGPPKFGVRSQGLLKFSHALTSSLGKAMLVYPPCDEQLEHLLGPIFQAPFAHPGRTETERRKSTHP